VSLSSVFFLQVLRVAAFLPAMLSRQAIRRFPYVLRASAGRVPATVVRRTLATPALPPSSNDPFANGTNAYYAEEMYRHWRQDPHSVHASWATYFSGMEQGLPSSKAFQPPPSLVSPPADGAPALHPVGDAELDDHLKVSLSLPVRISFIICIRSNS
jgi:2-oxoglutarate dehydrogenase E1 component